MSKRKQVEEVSTKTSVDILQYWATSNVGGSGMGVSIQQMIKNMAREILEHRNLPVRDTTALYALADTLDAEVNPGSKYAGQRLRAILDASKEVSNV